MINKESMAAEAIAILRANDRGGYTVPTAGLYPFQWNWDSAFCAMGFATFDEPRAWRELETLFSGQWEDGLVPHIIFHKPTDSYFPGPEVWRTPEAAGRPRTSGITQPPVAAIAARAIRDRATDRKLAEARLQELYPKLLASHRWWRRARDPEGSGLVALLHNWESGMDNSPVWDAALDRTPRTKTVYQRKDTGHVDASMRPRAIDYDRYVHLIEVYREAGWDPAKMWAAAPLKIAHIGVNAILLRAEIDLLALAKDFGSQVEQAEISQRIAAMQAAIAKLWSPEITAFQSFDLITGAPIDAPTSAGFLPLLTEVPTRAQVAAMVVEMRRWRALSQIGMPTVSPKDPRFEGKRYWRGPVWPIVNWLLIDGLARHGEDGLAADLTRDTLTVLQNKGFDEYFDPVDQIPCGGPNFSWSAATALWLMR